MKVIFNKKVDENITKIAEFTIDSNLYFRFLQENNKYKIKFRNLDYHNSGPKLNIKNIQETNQVIIGKNIYNNLKYVSSEIYVHAPQDYEIEGQAEVLVEDLNITMAVTK